MQGGTHSSAENGPNVTLVRVIESKLENLHNDVGDMKSVLRDLTTAVTKLAVVEERQGQASLALDRAFKIMERLEHRMEENEREIERKHKEFSKATEARFIAIETKLPGLIEKSGWLTALMLGLVAATLTALGRLLFK